MHWVVGSIQAMRQIAKKIAPNVGTKKEGEAMKLLLPF
jgi:hypothetical protein